MSFVDIPSESDGRIVWQEPPFDLVPHLAHVEPIVFANDRAVVVVDGLRVYPDGLEIEVSIAVRSGVGLSVGRIMKHDRNARDEGFQLWVRYEDGRSAVLASVQDVRPQEGEELGSALVLRFGGGSHRHGRWRAWMWPLPPGSAFTLGAAWSSGGVLRAEKTVDTQAIHATPSAWNPWSSA